VLRWALPVAAALVATAAISLGLVLRSGDAPKAAIAEPAATEAAATWSRGELRAPELALRDEDGRPLTLSSLRGRRVLVTFIDPLCRNLCPIEAQRLSSVVRALPAAERPVIAAVSVNIAGNSRAALALDRRKWRLPREWRWGIGDRGALARVWHAYHVQVLVTAKTVAGVRTQSVSHTEAAYLIDGDGYERALFLWPYTAAAVANALRASAT
jgi:cytochrome oxidase Cu insertion factor (SCO1/SenC/PrrC family)